jgi:hypothetical protein
MESREPRTGSWISVRHERVYHELTWTRKEHAFQSSRQTLGMALDFLWKPAEHIARAGSAIRMSPGVGATAYAG